MDDAPAPACGRPLRADAARNRARCLAAARELFAERGLDVTLDAVAERAGLGTGTVYRRFADRDALVEALFEERLAEQAALAERCLAVDDAWEGLTSLVRGACDQLALDRGLREVLLCTSHGHERVRGARQRLWDPLARLVARAQDAGVLRPDVGPGDLPLVFVASGGVADFAGAVAPGVHRRVVALLLEGLRARPGQEPRPGAALDREGLVAAMQAPGCRR